MTSAIVLVDLDDTLFQTLRKCPPDVAADRLVAYAHGRDGEPLSFATPAQAALIAWLEATTVCVAVTGRSTDALLRSRLRFDHAVAAHGGVVLHPATNVAEDWRAHMEATLCGVAQELERIVERVTRDAADAGVAVRVRIVSEGGSPLYVVAKHAAEEGDDAALHRACAQARLALADGWTTHANGNNVAYLPPGLGKASAVAWLLPRLKAAHPDLPVIGVGDSLTDADFMRLCDMAMLPTRSQLSARLFDEAAGVS